MDQDGHPEIHLRHIRDFLSVARTGSISGASRAIYKAPSAVARAIGELERGLGTPLFERKSRGMLLNAYGEAALGRARRIDDEIAAAIEEIARPARQHRPAERIAVANLLLNGRGLALLIGLADQHSLSAAAVQIGLSQAGASMALARMEAELGQPLFQRMMQGMIATDAGALLVARAKRIVAELRHMQADVASIGGTLQGNVTIGALPLGRTYILPTAITAALRRHPNIRIITVESPYKALAAGLRTGGVDFIVGALRENERHTGLTCERLFEDHLGVIVRAGHPLASRTPTLRDLLDEAWIYPRSDAPGRLLIELSFREAGLVPPVPSVETGDLGVLRGLLKASDMVTALSSHQLHYEIAAGDLVELPLALERTRRWIGITTREGALLSPAANAILEEIRAASRNRP